MGGGIYRGTVMPTAPHFLFETSKRKCAAAGGKEKMSDATLGAEAQRSLIIRGLDVRGCLRVCDAFLTGAAGLLPIWRLVPAAGCRWKPWVQDRI